VSGVVFQQPARLSFNRTVVLRDRIHLEGRRLAPGTVNLRPGAVRRLAYEAADCGRLSPDLAAGIRRVKGVKKIGIRFGNRLTAEQSQRLWQAPGGERLKEPLTVRFADHSPAIFAYLLRGASWRL
jgi:hypothetical protein